MSLDVNIPEVMANVLCTLSIVLAGRNNIHTWWTGIIGCAVFAWVFFDSQLYADTLLQVFFIVVSGIGWWQWLHGDDGDALPITRLGRSPLLRQVGYGVAGALVYGLLLHRFTDAYAPFLDSFILAFSIVAQLLMMRRNVQSWPFWLLVDTVAVPLYASRGLYLTSALYAGYWINAAISWHHWHRLQVAESMETA